MRKNKKNSKGNQSTHQSRVDNVTKQYSVSTGDILKDRSLIGKVEDKIDLHKQRKNKKKKVEQQMKQLGLHKSFDPDDKYSVTSRKSSINTWNEFFLVYFVMALSVFAFVSILVSYGYLLNPFEIYMGQSVNMDYTFVSDPSTHRQIKKADDTVNILANRQISLEFPTSDDVISGSVFLEGSATAFFSSVVIEIYDMNDARLASGTARLFGSDRDIRRWAATVDVVRSPKTQEGYILIYPFVEGSDSQTTLVRSVKFDSLSNSEIRVLGPLPSQVNNNEDVGIYIERVNPLVQSISVEILNESGEKLFEREYEFEDSDLLTKFVRVPSVFGIDGVSGAWVIKTSTGSTIEIPLRFQSAVITELLY